MMYNRDSLLGTYFTHSINSDLYIKQDMYSITTDDVQIRGVERRIAESDPLSFL